MKMLTGLAVLQAVEQTILRQENFPVYCLQYFGSELNQTVFAYVQSHNFL